MKEQPKVIKAENASNILELTFDNGEQRYLKTHYLQNYLDAWSKKKGKGKHWNLILRPTAMWQGSNPRVLEDGTVVLYDDDRYTPEELWQDSVSNVSELGTIPNNDLKE